MHPLLFGIFLGWWDKWQCLTICERWNHISKPITWTVSLIYLKITIRRQISSEHRLRPAILIKSFGIRIVSLAAIDWEILIPWSCTRSVVRWASGAHTNTRKYKKKQHRTRVYFVQQDRDWDILSRLEIIDHAWLLVLTIPNRSIHTIVWEKHGFR